jgi:hypothetical protein
VYSPAKLAETGTAEFQNYENVRIHDDSLENITPSGKYFEDKKINDARRQTQEALGTTAGKNFRQYVDNGISDIEQYLQEQVLGVKNVGSLLADFRTYEKQ